LTILFGGLALARAWPFVDDVSPILSSGDDWLTYKTLAVSVVRDGPAMVGLNKAYGAVPHGFLYVYFVAMVFAITGINASHVYVVQSALLGLSVGLMHSAFRRTMSPLLGLALLASLLGLVYIDVYRLLSFRLLSENLYFPLAAATWVLLMRDGRLSIAALAGACLGLTVLTRPSVVMAAALVLAIFIGRELFKRRWRHAIALMLGFALGLSPTVLRDWFATGQIGFQLVSNTGDWIRIWRAPLADFVGALGQRIAFAFGWTSLMQPMFRSRPHWMALWILAAMYIPLKIWRRESFSVWEWSLGAYICGYIGPVILVADISSYGGRMVSTILPAVAVLSIGSLRLMAAGNHGWRQAPPAVGDR